MIKPNKGTYVIVCNTEQEVRDLKYKLDHWRNKKSTYFDLETNKPIIEWYAEFEYLAKKAHIYIYNEYDKDGDIEHVGNLEQEGDIVAFKFDGSCDLNPPSYFIKELLEAVSPGSRMKCLGEPYRFFADIGDDRTTTCEFFYVTNDKRYLA